MFTLPGRVLHIEHDTNVKHAATGPGSREVMRFAILVSLAVKAQRARHVARDVFPQFSPAEREDADVDKACDNHAQQSCDHVALGFCGSCTCSSRRFYKVWHRRRGSKLLQGLAVLANGDNNAGGADDATIRCKMQKIIATKPSTWSRSCSIWFRASLPKRPTRATTAKDLARIWQEVGRRLTYQRSFAPAPCTAEYPSESHVM